MTIAEQSSLLGQAFKVDDAEYRVVDVRNIDGTTMVYAEPLTAAAPRAAFRLADLERMGFAASA